MKISKIGIDEDGVKTPYYDYMMNYAIPFCEKFYGKKITNPNGYDISEIFDISKAQRNLFWYIYIWGLFINQAAPKEDIEIMEKWLSEGRELDVITARVFTKAPWYNPTGPLSRALYNHRQKKDGLPVTQEHIIFCSEKNSADEKTWHIENLGTEIMMEDQLKNIKPIVTRTKCKVIMPIWPYNEHYDHPGVIKVPKTRIFYSADEIISLLEEGYPFEEVKKIFNFKR